MAEKKSIIEEALLDINNIQKALNANTKEILRSVAKEEIDSVVKESLLKEDDYEEEDLEKPEGETDLGGAADAATDNVEPVGDEKSKEDELGDIETPKVEPEMEPEKEVDTDVSGEDEIDMTEAPDEDVIAIYKKMSGEDEIEIVGDEIHLNISEPGEYVVKANELGEKETPTEVEPTDNDVDYEIEMGDDEASEETPEDLEPVEDEEGETKPEDEEKPEGEDKEDEIEENLAQTRGSEKHAGKFTAASKNPKPLDESVKAKQLVSETINKYNSLLTEAKQLKSENEQFRGALKEFRTKLVETVVFNSNLTYVTRLFMEHSTTKAEKQSIIERFDDEVTNLKESKKLYKTIVNELSNRKPINEAIENKIIKEVNTSASKQLTENTAYVDPSTKRIIELIHRVEKQ